jgi:imidazolonepropionase-like amidohydrolase
MRNVPGGISGLLRSNRKARVVASFLIAAAALWLVFAGFNHAVNAQNSPRTSGATLVLRGGLLIDGTGRPPVNDAAVVISGNRIQSAGTASAVTIPANATVIDTSGKTILPGLVDSHVHLRSFQEPAYLYWGVTTVGDLGNPQGWLLAYREAVEKGRQVGPYLLTAGAKLNAPRKPGQPLSPGDTDEFETFLLGNSARTYVSDEASADRAITAARKDGLDGIKLYTRMSPALMKTTTDIAHRNGFPVFAHFTSANLRAGLVTGTDEILDSGIDVHVHLFGLVKSTAPRDVVERIERGEAVQAWHLLDTTRYPPLIQKMVEKKMFLNPTVASLFENASMYLDGIDRLNRDFVRTDVVKALPEPIGMRFAAAFKGRKVPDLEEGYHRAGLFVREFVDQGGKVIAGSDTGAARLGTAGLTLHEEMRMLKEIGLSPMQVIQAATSWGMEAWRKSAEAGTVEAGKRADLLILNRNPLDDITATTDIFRVIQGGRIVDREGLAKWQETVPRPGETQENFSNAAIHTPFIDEIFPEYVTPARKNESELTVSGQNFSRESLVLLNDRLMPAKFESESRIRVPIPGALAKKPGIYPVVVVQPGSGGAVSNEFFLIVGG